MLTDHGGNWDRSPATWEKRPGLWLAGLRVEGRFESSVNGFTKTEHGEDTCYLSVALTGSREGSVRRPDLLTF